MKMGVSAASSVNHYCFAAEQTLHVKLFAPWARGANASAGLDGADAHGSLASGPSRRPLQV